MFEQRKISEKIDRHTASVEYVLTIVADVENFSAIAADYITFYNNFKIKYNIKDENDENIEKKQI
jgi:hypothetical protein